MVEKGNQFTINGDTLTFTTSGDDVEYWQYKYDLLNRLLAVTKNGTIVSEYAYSPEGLRVVKKANGVTIITSSRGRNQSLKSRSPSGR